MNHERHLGPPLLAGSFPSHGLAGSPIHPTNRARAHTDTGTREAAPLLPRAPVHASSSLSVCNGTRAGQPCFNAHASAIFPLSRGAFRPSFVRVAPRRALVPPYTVQLSPAAPGHDSTVIVSRNRSCLSLLLRRNRKCSIAAKRSVCFSCVWPVTAKPQQPFLPRCVFTAVRNQARVHGTEQTDTGHANAGSCHAQTRRWLVDDDDNRSASPNLFQGRNKSRGDTRVAAHIITHNHPSHDPSRSHNVSLLSQ
jgi:hypothetical protein